MQAQWVNQNVYYCWFFLGKVQEEIDREVGSSRQPSVADRENMPYTNAVIHEIQRCGNIIPINLPRTATEDTQVGNYDIPKVNMAPCLASFTFPS